MKKLLLGLISGLAVSGLINSINKAVKKEKLRALIKEAMMDDDVDAIYTYVSKMNRDN